MSSLRSSRAYSNLQVESIRWQQSALPPGSTNSFLVLDQAGQVGFSSVTNLPVNLNVSSLTATQGISAGNLLVSGGITTQNLTATNSTLTNVQVTGTFLVSGVTLIPSGISVIDAQYIFAGTPGLTLGREFKGYRLDVSGAALFNGGVTVGGPLAATNAVIIRGATAQILLENAAGITMGSIQGRNTGAYIESDNQIVFSSLDESAGDVVVINPKGSSVVIASGVRLIAGGVIDAQSSITNTARQLLLDTDTTVAGDLTLTGVIQKLPASGGTLNLQPLGGAISLATTGATTTVQGPLVVKEATSFSGNVSVVNNGVLSVAGGLTTTTGYFSSGVTVGSLITGKAGLTTTTGYFSSGVTMDSLHVNNTASVGGALSISGNQTNTGTLTVNGLLTGATGLTTTTGYFNSGVTTDSLRVNNAASVGGALSITGTLTVNGGGTGLAVTNNATIGGLLTASSGITASTGYVGTGIVQTTGLGTFGSLSVTNAATIGGLFTASNGITAASGYFGSGGVQTTGTVFTNTIRTAGGVALDILPTGSANLNLATNGGNVTIGATGSSLAIISNQFFKAINGMYVTGAYGIQIAQTTGLYAPEFGTGAALGYNTVNPGSYNLELVVGKGGITSGGGFTIFNTSGLTSDSTYTPIFALNNTGNLTLAGGVTVQGPIDARGGIGSSAGALALNDDVNVSGTLTATTQLNIGTGVGPSSLNISNGGQINFSNQNGPINCGAKNLLTYIPLAFGIEGAEGSDHLYYPHLTWTGSDTTVAPYGGAGFWSSSVVAISVAPNTQVNLFVNSGYSEQHQNTSNAPAVINLNTPQTWTSYSAFFLS